MDHDERMALINLKKCKYELQYNTSTVENLPTTTLTTATTATTDEDKQIQILRLQIQLAELTKQNHEALVRNMVHSPQGLSPFFYSGESSTPGSSRPDQQDYEDYSNPNKAGPSQSTCYIVANHTGQGGSGLGTNWVEHGEFLN